ncbi:hypothetical protein DACRYDRAFT_25367 [Dacryopinax primogenitus]|uniref:Uncharacterized protein n=1 Tax=Dacryopinax primogenitus (strain DJM 731) TaxID=1858805 RepID=M5FN70_DACPD|nr:uncharacterized protein DACRYDRAFT_25367 [Dacryopinax primogenitus]EJT96930.1 hypothetical protein DACRYDRAFT_25367 [Dacryopinax primogenitus]
MLALLTRLLTHHLPPVLSLVSFILALLALLSPVPALHTSVNLLSITPTQSPAAKRDVAAFEELSRFNIRTLRELHIELARDTTVDGPSIFMGLLGSCARSSNEADVTCTNSTFNPTYDLSALPTNTPALALDGPTASTPEFILTSIILLFLFSAHHALASLLPEGAKIHGPLGKMARAMGWLGVIGWLVGMVAVIVLRAWYGNAQSAFAKAIAAAGSSAPALTATVGNGFTMLWIAYAFAAPALLIALVKLNHAGLVKQV